MLGLESSCIKYGSKNKIIKSWELKPVSKFTVAGATVKQEGSSK
jgi:hypothetical protein